MSQWQSLTAGFSWEAGSFGGVLLAAGLWLWRRIRSSPKAGPSLVDRIRTMLAGAKREYVAQGDIQFLETALLTARTRLAETVQELERERTDRIAAEARERELRERLRDHIREVDSSPDSSTTSGID